MSTPPVKVLVFHGFAQSASVLSKRIGAVRKACKGVDLVFVDAPHVLTPADVAEAFGTPEDLGAADGAELDPSLAPRAWWKVDAKREHLRGIEETFAMLRDILAKDTYAGVFGFSQGAGMASLLAALLERPEVYPSFLIDGKPPHPPFKFCVSVSGFRPRGEPSETILSVPYSTPTVLVLGERDPVVSNELSKTLCEVSSNLRIEYHDGGHFVPSKAGWRTFFRDYMLKAGVDVPSPTAQDSQPASGAATPVPLAKA